MGLTSIWFCVLLSRNEETMAYTKLNHRRVQQEMDRLLMRPIDLAKILKVDRQLANYVIWHGGAKYADRLAKIFSCTKNDLLVMNTSRN